jgi:hypothetical protein
MNLNKFSLLRWLKKKTMLKKTMARKKDPVSGLCLQKNKKYAKYNMYNGYVP